MEVELIVDGKNIEINHFVKAILGNTVLAAATTLHGVEKDSKEIFIKLKQ